MGWWWHHSRRRGDCSHVLTACIQATSLKGAQGVLWWVAMSLRARCFFFPTHTIVTMPLLYRTGTSEMVFLIKQGSLSLRDKTPSLHPTGPSPASHFFFPTVLCRRGSRTYHTQSADEPLLPCAPRTGTSRLAL